MSATRREMSGLTFVVESRFSKVDFRKYIIADYWCMLNSGVHVISHNVLFFQLSYRTRRATWRLVAGRIWPAGRSLCTTVIHFNMSIQFTAYSLLLTV